MSYIFWSYNNSHQALGFIDARYCPKCKRTHLHDGLRHHRHFFLSFVPFYLSNRFYSVCSVCGETTMVYKEDRKYLKSLNKNACKFFKTTEDIDNIVLDVTNICKEQGVISTGKINEEAIVCAIAEVTRKYNVIHNESYERRFYEGLVRFCSENLLTETLKPECLEDKLLSLKSAYEKGLISEEEYSENKRKILSEL